APATLLLEAARQLDAQVAGPGVGFGLLVSEITDYLHETSVAEDRLDAGRLLDGRQGLEWIDRFSTFYAGAFGPPAHQRPGPPGSGWFSKLFAGAFGPPVLLLVLDTYEEVQYRSRYVVEQVWRFLQEFREAVPQTRVVVAGRAPVAQ